MTILQLRHCAVTICFALLVMGCRASSPAAPAVAPQARGLPDSLVLHRKGSDFVMSIVRRVDTDEARRLIEIAEGASPDTAILRSLQRADPILPSDPADRWWHDRLGGTLIPYALTGKAVMYYRQQWETLLAGVKSGPDRVTFAYAAIVEPEPSRDGLRIVTLRLNWSESCKAAARISCYWSFTHERRVYIDTSGKVVRIEGDGKPMVILS